MCGVPHVYSAITGLGYLFTAKDDRKKRLRAAAQRGLRWALRRNAKVFFQNPDDCNLFIEKGIIPGRQSAVIVNGSGVDLDAYHEAPLDNSPITFLMVARIHRDKGVMEYVEAANAVMSRHPTARFQLVGPFDDHPTAIPKDRFEEICKAGAIEYLGGTTDVRPYLRKCHVFVLPSYREGLPRSVLEAMATGRAVITTDAPGCRETVIPNYNGLLVPIKDSAALAGAIESLLARPERIELMGKNSRKLVEEKFDVKCIVADMLRTMCL
jgi:glycosyltransferase involved in cell wall biosynthesis